MLIGQEKNRFTSDMLHFTGLHFSYVYFSVARNTKICVHFYPLFLDLETQQYQGCHRHGRWLTLILSASTNTKHTHTCTAYAIAQQCVDMLLIKSVQRLPGKFKKMYTEFECVMDPSRNHRAYRLSVSKMRPPTIPFMPLLMKGIQSLMLRIASINMISSCLTGIYVVVTACRSSDISEICI